MFSLHLSIVELGITSGQVASYFLFNCVEIFIKVIQVIHVQESLADIQGFSYMTQ